MKTRVASALIVLALSSSALPSRAHANWGFLAGLEHVFNEGREVILDKAAHLIGMQRSAWIVLSRAFGIMASKSIAAIRAAGVVAGLNIAAYFRKASNAFLVGVVRHNLSFSGGGLVRWLEGKTADYAKWLSSLVRGLGGQDTFSASIKSYAARLFTQIRAIVAGTVRVATGTASALVADYDRVFGAVVQYVVRVARAAPARAKAALDRAFGKLIHGLVS